MLLLQINEIVMINELEFLSSCQKAKKCKTHPNGYQPFQPYRIKEIYRNENYPDWIPRYAFFPTSYYGALHPAQLKSCKHRFAIGDEVFYKHGKNPTSKGLIREYDHQKSRYKIYDSRTKKYIYMLSKNLYMHEYPQTYEA